jgi:hypothetical protein
MERFVPKSNVWSEGMKLHAYRFNRATMIFARRHDRRVTARFAAESDGKIRVKVAQRAVCGENSAAADFLHAFRRRRGK